MITLTLGVILTLACISYLLLVGNQKTTVTRSQTWNAALTMAEAGIEEAMAQINASPGDFSANGWGNNFGPVTRTLIGGSYSVQIVGYTNPIIYSTGYATLPITSEVISRSVRVDTGQLQSVFNVAFAAVYNIDFNGNGVASDSYNSHDNTKSNNGLYDPSKASTNGNVASVSGLVDIGGHTINGSLYLGPTATYNGGGIINGTIYRDFNVSFDTVTLPAGANNWPIATPTIVTTILKGKTNTTATYNLTNSGNYIVPNGAYPIIVGSGATVTLNITATTFNPSSLQIQGGINNSGTAKIYFNGPDSATIHGNDAIDASLRPENLQYFGLASLEQITFDGNSTFVGVIYAPQATFTLNGGGNNIGFIGSSVTKSMRMNGRYNFHYDESLAGVSISRGYIATAWQEIY